MCVISVIVDVAGNVAASLVADLSVQRIRPFDDDEEQLAPEEWDEREEEEAAIDLATDIARDPLGGWWKLQNRCHRERWLGANRTTCSRATSARSWRPGTT